MNSIELNDLAASEDVSIATTYPNLIYRSILAKRNRWLIFVVIVVFMLGLPFIHFCLWPTDEGILLHGAELLSQGRRIYVDFDEIIPPGGFAIVAAWFHVFGPSIVSAHLLATLTVTGIACFTYLACWQATRQHLSSAFVTIAWAVISQGTWTQVSHHWLATLFSVVSLWATLVGIDKRRRSRWGFTAGLSAGAAAMVTHPQGALTMLAAAIEFMGAPGKRNELIAFLFGGVLLPGLCLVYLASEGALEAAFNSLIVFDLFRYPGIQGVPYGFKATVQSFPIVLVFPFTIFMTILNCFTDFENLRRDRKFRICLAFGLASFILCLPRPDPAHLIFVAPMVFPLLLYSFQRFLGAETFLGTKTRLILVMFSWTFMLFSLYDFAFIATDVHQNTVSIRHGGSCWVSLGKTRT